MDFKKIIPVKEFASYGSFQYRSETITNKIIKGALEKIPDDAIIISTGIKERYDDTMLYDVDEGRSLYYTYEVCYQIERLETDEEYFERVKKEEKLKKEAEEKEKILYLTLKAKYENV